MILLAFLVAAAAYEPVCKSGQGCVIPHHGDVSHVHCPYRKHPQPGTTGAWAIDAGYTYFFDQSFANAALDLLGAGTVLELGAGMGCYSTYWRTSGRLAAVDACDGATNVESITEASVAWCDLTLPLDLGRRYNWVVMLEVAEHVPAHHERVLLANVARHAAHGVVLSWAVEGQGGVGHVNERNNEYVRRRMAELGFTPDFAAEAALRSAATLSWFKRTVMVFTGGVS